MTYLIRLYGLSYLESWQHMAVGCAKIFKLTITPMHIILHVTSQRMWQYQWLTSWSIQSEYSFLLSQTIAKLTTIQIGSLGVLQIKALRPQQLQILNIEQIQALEPSQIEGLFPIVLSALNNCIIFHEINYYILTQYKKKGLIKTS